jgi:hypothetical protein
MMFTKQYRIKLTDGAEFIRSFTGTEKDHENLGTSEIYWPWAFPFALVDSCEAIDD